MSANIRGMARTGIACALCWLAGLATGLPCAAEGWPHERTAGIFHCHADFHLDRYPDLWPELDALQSDLSRALQIPQAQEPIHLFLFSREDNYRAYLSRYFPAVPYRRALYIKEDGPGMVFAHLNPEFEIDLRHESTHALLHAVLPVGPLWLDEGLAEYFESPADVRSESSEHLRKTQWGARFGQVPRLTRLESIGSLREMGTAEYRQSWAWVHFMMNGPAEANAELIAFLDNIRAYSPPGILSQRLQQRIPDVEARFLEHFRNW